jgi:hypothetical protein
MQVLVHFPSTKLAPVGIWWLPKHQSRPLSFYTNQEYYVTGASAVFGEDQERSYIFSIGRWNKKVADLTESTSPLSSWQVYDTGEDPKDFLASLQKPNVI